MKDAKHRYSFLISALIPVLLAISCHKNYEVKYAGVAEVYAEVFEVPDSLPIINIDFSKSRHVALAQIDSVINLDTCNLFLPFAHTLSNGKLIKFNILLFCPSLIPYCGPRYEFRININSQGQILADGEYFENITSLNKIIESSFITELELYNKMSLKWTENIPTDSIEKALMNIKIGFIKVYKNKANKRYKGKGFYEIKPIQRDSILKEIPFNIYIDIGRTPEPPPLQIKEIIN
ncbi:MAG: hypothetical protein R3279_09230 [Putridiphycobacter sp.]|nr:hypothetical protein [Putridiphycobacter sp.]